jgi:hypothetical protein
MPSVRSRLSIHTYSKASDLPEWVLNVLRDNARNANVILPPALKIRAQEQSPDFHQDNVWITCASQDPPYPIEFVLACAEGHMGSYPLFIMTTLATSRLTDEYIQPSIQMMAQALKEAAPVERIYSVFAPEPIAKVFEQVWTKLTGIKSHTEPYYAANITYCTKRSFINRQASIHPSLTYDMEAATPDDINGVAKLCFHFADDSVSNHHQAIQTCLVISTISSPHLSYRWSLRSKKPHTS